MRIFQVDAFTEQLFAGNPAAVVPSTTWLPDELMQNIAAENNLSETAFIVPKDKDIFYIRWFTPTVEVDLCGHATLAAAHVCFEHMGHSGTEIKFDSKSGQLSVRKENGLYVLNFPTDALTKANEYSHEFEKILKTPVVETYRGKFDFLVVVKSETAVANVKPDFAKLRQVPARGVIVTAKGSEVDFVSRCFYPQSGVNEDPVTGSAHSSLMPYWAEKLTSNRLVARQISRRGGTLFCKFLGNRVEIAGNAVTFLSGELKL